MLLMHLLSLFASLQLLHHLLIVAESEGRFIKVVSLHTVRVCIHA